jgi:hypothetical protein
MKFGKPKKVEPKVEPKKVEPKVEPKLEPRKNELVSEKIMSHGLKIDEQHNLKFPIAIPRDKLKDWMDRLYTTGKKTSWDVADEISELITGIKVVR